MKRILILDDQPSTLGQLTRLAGELDLKSEVFPFDNVKDAYQCAMEKMIDLFVVDIILDVSYPGDTSGLDFARNIRSVEHYGFTPMIFVTSLEDERSYTYEKLHCYSYIEKPFDEEKVKKAISECLKFPSREKQERTLYFRKDGVIWVVEREDLVFAESANHLMHIHTRQGDKLSIPYITVKKLLEELDSPNMIQCSRSTIVNRQYVKNVDLPNRVIELRDEFGRVEIGVMYKNYIKELFM